MDTREMMKAAKKASCQMGMLTTEQKNLALTKMADALIANVDKIIAANDEDMAAAKGVISDVMLDRLMINKDRIESMAAGIRDVVKLPDPVGRILDENEPKPGLKVKKVSVPIGVIAIIYESRPNVTADAAALTLKSGNACVLRGGKEAYRTARAIADVLRAGVEAAGIDKDAINLVDDTSRESANLLMTSPEYIDLLIPRGGAGLINACVKNATVPCIATGTGICHVYVDKAADLEKAVKIVENAKTSRPSVCNAEEVLLVDKAIAGEFLPMIKATLVDKRIANGQEPVELRLDEIAAGIIEGTPAGEKDFDTEFLDYILAVKCVDGVEEAIDHVQTHSTGHSDAIITEDEAAAGRFTAMIDSAAVYVNASTRFTDGGEFGLGCEIGISTQKLHARGPMGLCEMNTHKYIVTGNGNIR
ncbi:MAG: glutamate-5-semialdehyde dehydrogenase [Lachnospiraceae bacterium]|nr:glutamate-5-semialdehyde dehydrogenase [Lachnospiraceae bacterium]